MRRLLAVLAVCLLSAACGGPPPTPVVTPDPHLKPGTVPTLQPITTPYPAVSTAVWNQAGANQFGTSSVSAIGPAALPTSEVVLDPQQESEDNPAIGDDGTLFYTVYPELRIY